ncbi:MAG: protein-export chaperone SecB [Rickettsiales bacterium]|jgi:preprotein translocase subunit SecB|nr:protein-export chaperone SecB [Rickettsiales bacterium]
MKKDQLGNKTTVSPSISLNGQYIKELHFENINSPTSFSPQKESPKIEIAINFNNKNVGENTYEVILVIKSKAISQDENNITLFDVKLAYAGLVTLNDVIDEEQKEAILNIHIPTLLFPYARHVLSDVTRDGGFQPIMLEPMDFAAIHKERKQQKEKHKDLVKE